MHRYRTHTCGALRLGDDGATVRLSGWCHRIRDHGGLLFIDLRDHYGITQCVVDPDSPAFAEAETLRSEFVIRVDGNVRQRPPGTENPEMPTGLVEVYVREIEVLGPAGDLPLPVFGDQPYPEDTRLRYRFLDLRREKLHRNIMLRGQIIDSLRRRMKEQGFFEFQTPILTASSPEGARDFLVPSRLHPGKFYALPQAPQQFKQLIMVAGFDRYFQIAPCFRDEDARADRSPGEFYQLDVEMSFVTQEDVFAAVEPVLRGVFEEFSGGRPVTQKFPMIPYAQAMLEYRRRQAGSAQSDQDRRRDRGLRARRRDVQRLQAGHPGRAAWCAPSPRPARLGSRARSSTSSTTGRGARARRASAISSSRARATALAGKGPIAKFLSPRRSWRSSPRRGSPLATPSSSPATSRTRPPSSPGAARIRIGNELGALEKGRLRVLLDRRFPDVRVERGREEDRLLAQSLLDAAGRPRGARRRKDPLTIKAFQYDIVCNGVELSSGAIRNHRPDIMRKAFEIAGYGEDVLLQKFGGMYRAFQCGAPPHGGIAPGIDRIVMLLAGEENMREVVLFPMNQRAEDLLMGAPSPVSPKQLRELHIRLALPEK